MVVDEMIYILLIEVDLVMIKMILLYCYFFFLVDKVCDIVLLKSCVGVKNVILNELYFEGYFL